MKLFIFFGGGRGVTQQIEILVKKKVREIIETEKIILFVDL